MSDVQRVTVQLKAPSGDYTGQVTTGYYVVENGLLVMTDGAGVPVRKENGEQYSHTLGPKDKSAAIAAVKTREIRRDLYGDSHFRGRIDYPKWGFG